MLTELFAGIMILVGLITIGVGVAAALPPLLPMLRWREWYSQRFALATLTIIGGFGLVGLAQAVRLLLAINGKP